MSECIDWTQDPPGSEGGREAYRQEQQVVLRIHTRALDFMEQRWREIKELSLSIPRQKNKRRRVENLIRSNVMCILNTQANRILLTHTGRLIYPDIGITYAGNGIFRWKKRAIKSPRENMWPTVFDHYDTYWDRYNVLIPDSDDLELCQICEATDTDEYTHENIELLLEEARLMVRTFRLSQTPGWIQE